MFERLFKRLAASVVMVAAVTACADDEDEANRDDLIEYDVTETGLRRDQGGINGDPDYCTGAFPTCDEGEGDCDGHADCGDGINLRCGRDNGPNFRMPKGWDVCVQAHCTNGIQDVGLDAEEGVDCGGGDCGMCPGAPLRLASSCSGTNGDYDFCTTSCPCGQVGQGDCDDDTQCANGLVCKNNVGPAFGFPSGWDVCVAAHCRNGTQDAGETGRDCGSLDCDACVTPATCGNGVRDSGERCDDGNTVTETSCPTGQASCTICNANCSQALTIM